VGKWLIPDGDAPSLESVTVKLPADAVWASRFWGAFLLLAAGHNWEETDSSTLTPAEAASVFLDCLWAGVQEGAGMEIGTIILWGAAAIPDGWLECDGQWLAQAEYPDLFAVIGSTFGGLGSSFQVPDLAGSFPLGESAQHALASVGGAETHQLALSEIPSHRHSLSFGTTKRGERTDYSPFISGGGVTRWSNYQGGGNQHNNMPPFLTLYFIIKADD